MIDAKRELADVLSFVIDDPISEACAVEHVASLRAMASTCFHPGDALLLERAILTLDAKIRARRGESRTWVAELINPLIVPYEYLTPALDKIQRHAEATPTDRAPSPIGGVRFTLR